MRKWVWLGLLTAVAWVGGCATVTRTAKENELNYKAITEMDARQIATDWNMIWLADRPSRLMRWYSR